MKLLISSDTHFSDNSRDTYRFGLFPWFAKQQEIYKVDGTFLLGDICEQKNNHSAELVNSIIDGLKLLKPPIFILKGNHDYIREDLPFFKFLNRIKGITFCTEPTLLEEFHVLMVPHQLNQIALDKALQMAPDNWLVFAHQTMSGAVSETGARLTGLIVPSNCKAKALYSGDVHVPQILNSPNSTVVYIGAPYHVRFGDTYRPRILLLDNKHSTDLHYPAPRKLTLTIRDVSELKDLDKSDQVKVTLELPRSEAVEWANHKKSIIDYCKAKGVEVYGTELKVEQLRKRPRLDENTSSGKGNSEYFEAFCRAEKIPIQIKKSGIMLLVGEN